MSWWSRTYNRPLKDPILLSYTFEELLYEYYDHYERLEAKEEEIEAQSDRIELEKDVAASDWADEMERKEEEEIQKRAAAQANKKEPPKDPREDLDNVEWMEKLIEEEKKKRGEDFGENVDIEF